MQKKIIALAIASALTVPAMAFAAEATVTGQVNMSVDIQKDGLANQGTSNNLTSNQSRLIFKGSEDLGSGNSVIWQLDNRFNADTGNNGSATSLWSGNTFLGMQSNSMGTLRVGIMDTAYKSSTRNLDVFFDVAGDNRVGVGAGGATGGGLLSHDKRYANAMNYNSPNMGGLSVAASTVFGAENAASGDTKGSYYSLAGMYSMEAIYATLAYQTLKYGSVGDLNGTAGRESKALKVGGGFKTDAFTLNAVIERPTEKANTAAADVSTTNFYVGGSFALGSADSVRAAFTKRGASSGASNDAKQYAIGYAHDMSKATSVYVTYVKTTDNATGAADPSALSLGMKHSF